MIIELYREGEPYPIEVREYTQLKLAERKRKEWIMNVKNLQGKYYIIVKTGKQ